MFEDRFDVNPRRPGHQPDQDPPETQPVRDTWTVTTQRMIIDPARQQRLHGPPDHIHNFGLERAHDDKDLHLVVVFRNSTRDQTRAVTTTGGWSPIRAAP